MISIAEAISDLLFIRDTVVVPGLGAFVKKPVSAKVNPVANHFTMPSSSISFDSSLREDNDLVIQYLSDKNDIPEDEARRVLVMFVSDCFNSLKEGKKVVLNDIGTLFYDWAGDLAFEPAKTMNYNADAFGLCDITPEPVLRSKTKEEIREEIAKQQKDKNTPVTVDEKAVHERDDEEEEDDDESGYGHGWLWVLLGLLLLSSIAFGLHYFKAIDFRKLLGLKEKEKPFVPWTVTCPDKDKAWKWVAPVPVATDTVTAPPTETAPTAPVVEGKPASMAQPAAPGIRIVAGCFDKEENAQRLANTLKAEGFATAFYEPRGKRWFVSFGRYNTEEEADAALREIRTNTDYEAWILKEKPKKKTAAPAASTAP